MEHLFHRVSLVGKCVRHLLGAWLNTLGHLLGCGSDLARLSTTMDIPFIVLLYLVTPQPLLYGLSLATSRLGSKLLHYLDVLRCPVKHSFSSSARVRLYSPAT